MLKSSTDTFNFDEEVSFQCSCDTLSDNLATGKTLSVASNDVISVEFTMPTILTPVQMSTAFTCQDRFV